MYIVNVLRAKRKEGNSNCLYYHPLYIRLHTEHAVYYIRGNISTNSVMAELFKEFIKFMPGIDTSKLYFQNPNNDGPVVQHAMIDAEINSSI